MGSGWLRESPQNFWSGSAWNVRGGKSALRKCMFLPVPEELRGLFPRDSAPLPRAPAAVPQPIVAHRHDPRNYVRQLPAYPLGAAQGAEAQAVLAGHRAARAWWEHPVALGALLIVVPPIGLAAVWSSKRYSSEARLALTMMTALTMCLTTAVVIAALMTL